MHPSTAASPTSDVMHPRYHNGGGLSSVSTLEDAAVDAKCGEEKDGEQGEGDEVVRGRVDADADAAAGDVSCNAVYSTSSQCCCLWSCATIELGDIAGPAVAVVDAADPPPANAASDVRIIGAGGGAVVSGVNPGANSAVSTVTDS